MEYIMDPKIVQMVAQLLKSGVSEEEIVAKLVQGKIPQAVAEDAIAKAKNMLQGSDQAGKPEGVPDSNQGMAMIRQVLTQVPVQVVLFIIKALMMMKGDQLNALVANLEQASKEQGSAPAQEGQDQGQGSPAGQQQQQPPQELQI